MQMKTRCQPYTFVVNFSDITAINFPKNSTQTYAIIVQVVRLMFAN